jgi:hypothetical protein
MLVALETLETAGGRLRTCSEFLGFLQVQGMFVTTAASGVCAQPCISTLLSKESHLGSEKFGDGHHREYLSTVGLGDNHASLRRMLYM